MAQKHAQPSWFPVPSTSTYAFLKKNKHTRMRLGQGVHVCMRLGSQHARPEDAEAAPSELACPPAHNLHLEILKVHAHYIERTSGRLSTARSRRD